MFIVCLVHKTSTIILGLKHKSCGGEKKKRHDAKANVSRDAKETRQTATNGYLFLIDHLSGTQLSILLSDIHITSYD